MTSLAGVRLGAQTPRIQVAPPSVTSAGQEAAELAESVGLILDPWQRHGLDVALGERADGRWAAFEVAWIVSRQNGKGGVLEARELAGLFLFGEELILHSAHEFKTAAEAFRRVLALIEGSDDLRKRVLRVRTSHGEEGIELRTGQRLRFVARSSGSGRGFSGDCLILDEAMILGADAMAALLPTLSARPNPQVWYTESAALSTSTQLHAVRRRALAGGDGGLAYMEWSAPADCADDDREAWAAANPALGIRITEEFVERERAALPRDVFRRERLGIPDEPLDGDGDVVLDPGRWGDCCEPGSMPGDRVVFSVDIAPDRRMSSIGVAGARADGLVHLEVVAVEPGVAWVLDRLVAMAQRADAPVVVDLSSAAGALAADLTAAGVKVVPASRRDVAAACGRLVDQLEGKRVRHIGQQQLDIAVAGAVKRPLGDVWVFDRRSAAVDITPLYAVTLAAWGLVDRPPVREFFVY